MNGSPELTTFPLMLSIDVSGVAKAQTSEAGLEALLRQAIPLDQGPACLPGEAILLSPHMV